jgi:hypothetical protein
MLAGKDFEGSFLFAEDLMLGVDLQIFDPS